MNSNTNKPNSEQKRATLKRLKNVGVGTAAIAAIGSSEWVRPIVNQVVLPAHAVTTVTCGGLKAVVTTGRCSSGMPVEIVLSSVDGTPLDITSVPSIQAIPATTPQAQGDWTTTVGGAVPATITDVIDYPVTTRGQVMFEIVCKTPATGSPNSPNQRPLTALNLTVDYICSANGLAESKTIDILPLI